MRSRRRRMLPYAVGAVVLSLPLLLVPARLALAQPSFVDSVICGVNEGWAAAPTVFIDSDGAPTVARNGGGSVGGVLLVQDAISDYWNEDVNVDGAGEDEDPASSDFSGPGPGFGTVTVGSVPGAQSILISFDALPGGVLGQASCTVDGSTGNIVSATVTLTTAVGGLTDEDYKNIAAHELGHVIGLQHNGRPGTLMFRFSITGLDAYLPLSPQSQRALDRLYD